MKKLLVILLTGWLLLIGCQPHDHELEQSAAETEVPAIAITQWTEKMEIFMEYETAVVGQEIKFIIHLTTMADFQPVREGMVSLHFKQPNGSTISVQKDELLREGIFTPVKIFETEGDYQFSINYQGAKATESFSLGTFRVYKTFADIPASEEEDAGEEISYLKEQQWKTSFATEVAQMRPIKSSVGVVGEVRVRPASYAEIVSPVEGIISITEAKRLVKPGQKISIGQTMAVIVPPLVAKNSWAKIYLDYEQSKTEYERAQRLKDRAAISERDFEQAKRNYEINKAGFSNYFDSDGSSLRFDSKNNQFLITAPISGIVSDVSILPGQKIDRHQKLFSIVNPDMVWLKLDVFAEQAKNLTDISGASINIPGNDKKINLDRDDIKLISRGEMIDPQKRTLTLWLEAKNYERKFLIGQTFSAQIYTNPEQDMLTVPLSAVYDDNSKKVIFVHSSGESFEKRELETGPVHRDYISILKGVSAGERVVSLGGYQVKLASTSEEIGHPHAH
ncbi:MAG: efflux RND transporter periplasmic adaptor subunit [Calditrichaeota bacterium]|nr:MAG: efflux RND transporter periplasmic adaptor subunit [Calditrichota bacterium]MBL1207175.1 efflux RND transporter periplasmic adaptor subunit [Calditrichota bacterium]NOG47007.1 efflux RND transporter periplasmic adaptor subunit [Calditrichota bacterium]